MKTLIACAAASVALAALAAGPANAWTLSNDNGGDGYFTAASAPYSFELFGSDNGAGNNTASFLNTAAAAETVAFNWSYTTYDCCGSYWDPAGYVVNGVETVLTPGSQSDIGATYTGTFSLSLNAGDTYGFYVYSPDSIEGRGAIEFGGVPEPASWGLMMVGLGMAGYALRQRRVAAQA